MIQRYRGIQVLFLIVIISIWVLSPKRNITGAVEKKLDIKLVNRVAVIEEQRAREYGEEHVNVKLLIKEGNTQAIKQDLEAAFSGESPQAIKPPNLSNTCSWWDLKEGNIINQYYKMMEGKSAKTIGVWAFIVRESKHDYLYISY